jgi:multidrug transporter EmrE-like cation transporter
MMPYVLTIIAVMGIAVGQILFKTVASRIGGRGPLELFQDSAVMLPFIASLAIYGAATILWILALQNLQLSRAYMFMSLSFIIVPVISMVFFGETLSLGFLVGLGLIIAGVTVTQVYG